MRQAERKELTHKKIVDASIKVFADRGLDAAKLEDIAKVAGIGKGSIYNYYESKEELYYGIVEYAYSEIFDREDPEIGPDTTLEDVMRFKLTAYYTFAQEHPDTFKMIFKGMARLDKAWYQNLRKFFLQHVERDAEILQRYGIVPEGMGHPSDELTLVIMSIVDTAIFNWLIEGQNTRLTDKVETLVNMLVGGLERIWQKNGQGKAK
ncbi:MAG: hypothetical protein CVV64_19810 [Candidatus Wallbacteria bacterium HGW-Wallbacteria-1]|jgi:AcrR family transcriptional regulator|uniref:HTH tetR-type domain-containing protein n=1 Tax=Candidatus Wallbacteria bacterium HGW-Wallbacteria-1 TaxID=2013854 RepID=A0A2N1PIP2_9BACT|nr:MAG: hypothetical protein CVV64_19810 [Candidatus Wallbacteria bacterium HGW-Wallbacteria-1]